MTLQKHSQLQVLTFSFKQAFLPGNDQMTRFTSHQKRFDFAAFFIRTIDICQHWFLLRTNSYSDDFSI